MDINSQPSPRDRLGRPLRGAQSAERAFPQVPERTELSGETAWVEAENYLAADLPFHVHEVCEQRWRCAPEVERTVWRGLAQWGAALTHKARGNDLGALRLAQRAQGTINASDYVPDYIDIDRVHESLRSLLA